ncbi:VOC family protein [Rhodococcus sp. IEGM 1305]|uniref:VOC family protein n=1 Tax=Rhodococcus sp. IEGM 1305 TaxID=3047092 RepID=UPI0024B6BD21|nr:VOC family protein [Rhodococcus sp. IEGM 1305]MDI9953616.1 VOC family protein [Rhodococcus sp. IEGM 1305]
MTDYAFTHLRHVALAVPDYEKQLDFYTHQWGLSVAGIDGDTTYLAAEGSPEQYVVRIRKATDKRLDLISYGAADAATVDGLAEKLGRGGVQLVGEPDTLHTPGGGYGFRFFDNDGRTIEISADVAVRRHRTIEEGESIPVKLSHVVVNTTDPEGTVAFYEKHFGFKVSDILMHPRMGNMMWFMRTNNFHHSMAIARGPHAALHHASFEMRGIDEYMRGTGRMLRAGVEKIWGPGRHQAGNNTFSYFLDPNGNTMEYTTELDVVDEDSWHPHLYDFSDAEVTDQWGTANAMDEFVAAKSFNDVDKGLFVAPPV